MCFGGVTASHIMKVINEVANKHKVIALNASNTSDDIQNAENFGRYSFQGSFSADQVARGLAYYYGQIKKKEKKFYILCQDYGFGHIFADGFKNGLKEYFPEAQIVGEDYHKLFLTGFCPLPGKNQGLRRRGHLYGRLGARCGQSCQTGSAIGS